MNKKLICILLILFAICSFAFAEDQWWVGMKIGSFKIEGLSLVSDSDVNDVLYPYKGQEANEELVNEIALKLSKIDGIASVETGATTSTETGNLILVYNFTELPKLGHIFFSGNSKVKEGSLKEAVKSIKVGQFINPEEKALFEQTCKDIAKLYADKGFGTIPVEYSLELKDNGLLDVTIYLIEGIQTRISSISFVGNENISYSSLKKVTSSRKKTLFNSGYLNENTIIDDANAILEHYQSLGYLDAEISYSTEDLPTKKEGFQDVALTFTINEGLSWNFGGMNISGNTIFTTEEINSGFVSKVGETVNISKVESDFASIQDLYYNNGYITTPIEINEIRDEENLIVSFDVVINEGAQSFVERIEIEGLEKTKDHVMRREISIHEGDIFSKEELITSLQNLYNTGLLEDVNYDIAYGQQENGVILKFIVKEGSHMNIQFGATFGGNVTGFPISGFLQWSDTNLGGNAQEIDVSTTLSPDSQKVTISFGDSWFRNVRWANSFNVGFTHSKYKDEPQLATGFDKSIYKNINYDDIVYPAGFESIKKWADSDFNASKNPADLMNYQLYTLNLGYSTGYTWIFNKGRLSVNGGADSSLNRAVYDKTDRPFDKMIYKYGQKWQFTNKLSVGATWDGRDYINNPTKGYVASTSFTYAGGLLGGLSNYMKVSGSLSGYFKLFEVNVSEKPKNIMLCASTSVSTMLPQFYKHSDIGKRGWYDASLGASKYEMLYIDGMTIARGHDSITGLDLIWDNTLEVSYTLADNIIQAEAFVSATGAKTKRVNTSNKLNWYYAVGAGVKLKVPGFPLGLYLVKNASSVNGSFQVEGGPIFNGSDRASSGLKLVLAISTSLI